MLLFQYSIRIVLLAVFLDFYFPGKIVGSEKKCFIVEGSVRCYFSPNATSLYSWEEALTECRANGATLPDLPNKVIAGVLERYLESQKVDYRFWTSGRRIESQQWKWINGQSYNGTAVIKRHASDSQAVVTKTLTYLEQYPVYEKNYVCQHFGTQCQSEDAIRLSDGCLVLSSRELRNVSSARNDCLERGGDLPVIRTNEDLKKFGDVFVKLKDYAQIWIGLRRHWWTWNRENEAADIRFSSWADREGAKLYNNCMVVDADTFKWRQVNCSGQERVLCQTVVPEMALHQNDDKSSSMGGLVAGILIGIVIVAVAVVIAVLILRKRIRLPFDGFRRVKSVESPMAKPYVAEEVSTTPSSSVKVTTSRPDQGHYTALDRGHNPETSRGHYDKLNRRQVENRKSHNVEPCQRQKVDPSQSRKSEPCQGYKYEPFQGQNAEQGKGRRVEPSEVHSVPQRQSHKFELDQGHKIEPDRGHKVEPCQGQDVEVFQGQMDDQYQDHYAKIAQTTDANDNDEQPKTIVYAKLEFDAAASENLGSDNQRQSTDNPTSPTGDAVSGFPPSKISQQTSVRSLNGR